jgi:hypothetical protein
MDALLCFLWNEMETLESDDPEYAYVSYPDLQKLEELMIKAGGEYDSLAP